MVFYSQNEKFLGLSCRNKDQMLWLKHTMQKLIQWWFSLSDRGTNKWLASKFAARSFLQNKTKKKKSFKTNRTWLWPPMQVNGNHFTTGLCEKRMQRLKVSKYTGKCSYQTANGWAIFPFYVKSCSGEGPRCGENWTEAALQTGSG